MSWRLAALLSLIVAGVVERPATAGSSLPEMPSEQDGSLQGRGERAGEAKQMPCVLVHGEARATGYGYRHVVVLNNTCKVAATCDVSTDVNPQSVQVVVGPSEKAEVVTFVESPSYGFEPRVSCRR